MFRAPTRFLACGVFVAATLSPARAVSQEALPAGLFDSDPQVRVTAVEQAGKDRLTAAEGKLVSLLRSDPHPAVRAAAASALAALGATSRVELLRNVAALDADAQVRAAAKKAADTLMGVTEPQTIESPAAGQAAPEGALPEQGQPGYKKPEIADQGPVLDTRLFAVGFGSMGGYGIAALDLRFRFDARNRVMPWIALEIGGGWSPPRIGYTIVSGMFYDVTSESPERWTIVSGGGGLLFYFHRMHYVPVRAAFNPGQWIHFLVGYGIEGLNDEGFFSWGLEAGVLVQPWVAGRMDEITDCEADNECAGNEPPIAWPFLRFSLHFYLV